MMKAWALIGLAGLVCQPLCAQTPPSGGPAIPPAAPRARGPSLDAAVEAARTAAATCLASGYKVTVVVVDSAGLPVAMLSGNGAMERTQIIAGTKIAMVLKYRESNTATMTRAKTDPALTAEIAADPKIGSIRQGGLPIMAGGAMIGAIAVSGAPGGDKDEVCAQAGLDKVKGMLG